MLLKTLLMYLTCLAYSGVLGVLRRNWRTWRRNDIHYVIMQHIFIKKNEQNKSTAAHQHLHYSSGNIPNSSELATRHVALCLHISCLSWNWSCQCNRATLQDGTWWPCVCLLAVTRVMVLVAASTRTCGPTHRVCAFIIVLCFRLRLLAAPYFALFRVLFYGQDHILPHKQNYV